MKKKIILLVLLIFMISGCARIDNVNDYKSLVVNILESKKISTNQVGEGFKYYIPYGVKLNNIDDNNIELKCLNTTLYLYVDIVSYYYKNEINYIDDDNDDCLYYEEISIDNKKGFIKIVDESNDRYYVKIVFNYSKIEYYIDKYNLNESISYSTIILKNIRYNKNIIKNILDDSKNSSKETTYELEKPEDANDDDISKYIAEDYVTSEEGNDEENNQQLPDE